MWGPRLWWTAGWMSRQWPGTTKGSLEVVTSLHPARQAAPQTVPSVLTLPFPRRAPLATSSDNLSPLLLRVPGVRAQVPSGSPRPGQPSLGPGSGSLGRVNSLCYLLLILRWAGGSVVRIWYRESVNYYLLLADHLLLQKIQNPGDLLISTS